MPITRPIKPPGLCFTYDHNDPALLQTILPYIEVIETTPDTISIMGSTQVAHLNEDIIAQLQEVAQTKKIVAHGVGLSIGTFDGYSKEYIRLLDDMAMQLPLYWHSEHLGFTMVNGEYINVMLPVNRNKENLEMICDRVHFLQERYKLPFLLENIAHLIPDYDAEYTDAGFLNAIVQQTGCGLILDVYNMACDAYNYQFDIDAFVEELDLAAVREIHIANGSIYKEKMLDIHSNAVSDDVLHKTKDILKLSPNVEFITFELMPEAIPRMGYDNIEKELIRLRNFFQLN